ncbi:hypothetical protein BGZ54_005072 [Gamsiella multidivaricata]|nr:hypothetical protein BGZ54_005072 [Gamsiella multidivaricata]
MNPTILQQQKKLDWHKPLVKESDVKSSLYIQKPELRLDPSIKYLGFMPYAGLTNQFIALENAAYLALRLNRTLIITPITTNSHNKHNSNQPWSDYFDFDRFTADTGIPTVNWKDIRPLTPEQIEVGRQKIHFGEKKPFPPWDALALNLTCQIVYGYGDSEPLHGTEKAFARQFMFKPQFVRPPARKTKTQLYDRTKIMAQDNKNLEDIVTIDDLVDRYEDSQEQLLFLSHSYKLKDPLGRRIWSQVGQYLRFHPKVDDYVQRLIQQRAPGTISNGGKYIAIHVRRGDIWLKCRSENPDDMMACIIPLGHYAEAVEQAYQIAGKRLPVIVTTDSKSEGDLLTMAKLGWRKLNHELYTTEEELGIFGPELVDAAVLAGAEVMIGSASSTMTKVAVWRQKSWHQRDVLYPRTVPSWTPFE